MRNQLSRRTVLRGAGVSIALPLLEAMAPVSVQAATGYGRKKEPLYGRKKEPLRMAFVYAPNGIHMTNWTPQEEGRGYKLPPTLEPLRELQNDFSILSGLAQHHANANGDGGGDHARAMATFLTGAQARKTNGVDIKAGVSVDQIAAAVAGRRTRFASLEIGAEGGRKADTICITRDRC